MLPFPERLVVPTVLQSRAALDHDSLQLWVSFLHDYNSSLIGSFSTVFASSSVSPSTFGGSFHSLNLTLAGNSLRARLTRSFHLNCRSTFLYILHLQMLVPMLEDPAYSNWRHDRMYWYKNSYIVLNPVR